LCIFPLATTPTTPSLRWRDTYPVNIRVVAVGSSYSFDCSLTNSTVPVHLEKDNTPVTVDGVRVKLQGQTFKISNLQTNDNGWYSCHANGVADSKKIRINVDLGMKTLQHAY
jgi:hypothetical protein